VEGSGGRGGVCERGGICGWRAILSRTKFGIGTFWVFVVHVDVYVYVHLGVLMSYISVGSHQSRSGAKRTKERMGRPGEANLPQFNCIAMIGRVRENPCWRYSVFLEIRRVRMGV